ncbi:MAG: 4-hydroxy-tetrahydrodipicolinate synthase [Bacteroidales bacterium]|nr:4-hydroxy-tetrahydrodipicolinate synthase [Bacteroidales bacterium]
MNTNRFKGTGVAVITPFKQDKSIDFEAFGNVIEFLIQNGIDYIVALGTTGESATMNKDEKGQVIEFAVSRVNARIPVVVGIGGNNTTQIVDAIEHSNLEKVDGILSVAPYYNKPQQGGLYEHYKAISQASPAPIIVYNVPGRTGVNITAETTLRLAHDFENIAAVKEASGNLPQIMEIVHNKPNDFTVVSGDDNLTLPIMAIGGEGAISVVANAFPAAYSNMVNAALKGDFMQARKLHYQLLAAMKAFFADGNPAGIKAAMAARGLCVNALRLPLVPVKKEIDEWIQSIVQ